MNFEEYDSVHPYPSPKGIHPDAHMAKKLYRRYLRELDSVSQSLYNEIMLEESMQDLSGIFEHLAEKEALHVSLLGQAIRCLGENPQIRTRIQTRPVDLVTDIGCRGLTEGEKAMQGSMEDIREAEEDYRSLSRQTDDEGLSSLLLRLAEDEEKHYHMLAHYEL